MLYLQWYILVYTKLILITVSLLVNIIINLPITIMAIGRADKMSIKIVTKTAKRGKKEIVQVAHGGLLF